MIDEDFKELEDNKYADHAFEPLNSIRASNLPGESYYNADNDDVAHIRSM